MKSVFDMISVSMDYFNGGRATEPVEVESVPCPKIDLKTIPVASCLIGSSAKGRCHKYNCAIGFKLRKERGLPIYPYKPETKEPKQKYACHGSKPGPCKCGQPSMSFGHLTQRRKLGLSTDPICPVCARQERYDAKKRDARERNQAERIRKLEALLAKERSRLK